MEIQQEGLSFPSEPEYFKTAHSLVKAEDSHLKRVTEKQSPCCCTRDVFLVYITRKNFSIHML